MIGPMPTIASRAITWYDAHARDLPWRRPGTTPWGVLVSEVMLQQTPVSRVEPVWTQWMLRWPDPACLAAEPAGEAIRAWGRLGYPRRALRLHAAAGAIVSVHGGVVPSGVDQLQGLPGIGEYTARAVAVFGFGQRHPVVDTNVRRLIARAVHALPDGGAATSARDLAGVVQLLPEPPARAARASIAFMELGALVCTARAPVCTACPLRAVCAWRLGGVAAEPPRPARRPQGYAGTDRQVRGQLMAVLREATAPVSKSRLDLVWPQDEQRERALAGLLADGLIVVRSDGYVLP
jgi:A/G-specific adenine glycosylase